MGGWNPTANARTIKAYESQPVFGITASREVAVSNTGGCVSVCEAFKYSYRPCQNKGRRAGVSARHRQSVRVFPSL